MEKWLWCCQNEKEALWRYVVDSKYGCMWVGRCSRDYGYRALKEAFLNVYCVARAKYAYVADHLKISSDLSSYLICSIPSG